MGLSAKIIYMFMELVPSMVLISNPALIVESTACEVDRIKKTLTTQILRCSDESLRFELQTLLQYVRLRPFKYMICRAVPLDINLLFNTATLCITYIIVALQLTHFSANY
uniref:Gustatory receptor n=1 Tax=Heliothis virescens TaxID=7102 RepID=A0A2A4IVK0_HELVI